MWQSHSKLRNSELENRLHLHFFFFQISHNPQEVELEWQDEENNIWVGTSFEEVITSRKKVCSI